MLNDNHHGRHRVVAQFSSLCSDTSPTPVSLHSRTDLPFRSLGKLGDNPEAAMAVILIVTPLSQEGTLLRIRQQRKTCIHRGHFTWKQRHMTLFAPAVERHYSCNILWRYISNREYVLGMGLKLSSSRTEDSTADAMSTTQGDNELYGAPSREGEEDQHLRPTDLSELLKEGTKESHEKAENTKFVKEFLKGRIKPELFKLATAALYYTYSALEEELDRNKEDPAIAPLYFPQELHRAEALKKDVAYFYGEDWKDAIQCSDAAQAYVDRIRHLGRHNPELLVAHAYTRYMGDLSGGQVLKKVAQRALRLPSNGDGLQFYLFDNVTNAQQFKQLYRARLNTLELDSETKKSIVEEANKAFKFNMQ
ncbi:hypothetical protein GDO78_023061, partial [Eleutherodactylus coqui]